MPFAGKYQLTPEDAMVAKIPLLTGETDDATAMAYGYIPRELASRGITCNAVAPGFIQTDMTENLGDNNPLLNSIPLGRMGKPEDIAAAVAFLASDSAAYITGEVLKVDGGLAI